MYFFVQVLQNMTNLSLASGGRSLATIPPSERPKAKASRKIDGKGGKKSQLQAALQQHSQQLAQLQQLQQLNQQLQQQVLQQRQLKQQNQQTLAALQQNAIANQQQLAALQQNVAQLQQLEQTILAQQTTAAHQQQHQQLQQRVQQIMQQKQQLQHQIKQFQQQVEQQLAYTQHAGPLPPALVGGGGPPPLPSGPPPPPPPGGQAVVTTAGGGGGSKKKLVMGVREGGDGESVAGGGGLLDLTGQELSVMAGSGNGGGMHAAQQDLHVLINSDQLPGFMTSGWWRDVNYSTLSVVSKKLAEFQCSQPCSTVFSVQLKNYNFYYGIYLVFFLYFCRDPDTKHIIPYPGLGKNSGSNRIRILNGRTRPVVIFFFFKYANLFQRNIVYPRSLLISVLSIFYC